MNIIHRLCLLVVLITASALCAFAGAGVSIFSLPLDTVCTGLLRGHQFRTVIQVLSGDAPAATADPAYTSFKLAYAYYKCKEYSQALLQARLSAERSTTLSSLAYELIGDIEQAQGRPENALSAYRAAISPGVPEPYRQMLRKKMVSVQALNRATLGPLVWLGETASQPGLSASFMSVLDSLLSAGAVTEANTLLELCADSLEESRLTAAISCTLSTAVQRAALFESSLSTPAWFFVARAARICRKFAFADSVLAIVERRPDAFKKVSRTGLFYQRAMVAYGQQNYGRALEWFDRFVVGGGVLTPEAVITIARTHRNRNDHQSAFRWYQKHIRLFPDDKATPEIVWYMAWEKESAGEYARALELYANITKRYRRSARADDAVLRSGLCRYKEGRYDLAMQIFRRYPVQFPDSDLVNAALFWGAKCWQEQNRLDSARQAFGMVVQKSPYDYYAFRSRQILRGLDSSVQAAPFGDRPDMRQWLDSACGVLPLSDSEQDNVRRGLMLAHAGLTRSADLFFEPLGVKGSARAWLQLESGELYNRCGDSLLAFRAARRLVRVLVPGARSAAPLQIYRAAWPRMYAGYVEPNALRNGLDAALVYGVMRQESLFDSLAVSPVGAVGLMQIMPYTGKAIADGLVEPFVNDSLYRPGFNIRFGSSYIRQLLDQFGGNTVLAVASYNGGPHNALKWFERNKDESSDLFIEDIVFTETREYVKKVLANYWMYKAVW